MYYKRPSFKRGGPTGIAQLTPNRQRYAGGGNIGGGIISGSNLGTRSGFKYPNFPGFEFLEPAVQNELRSQMSQPSGKGLTRGSRLARAYSQIRPLGSVANSAIRGIGFNLPTAAVSSVIAAPTALAYMNKAKTLEGLNYMKSMNNSGIFDETAMPGEFEQYGKDLKKIDAEGKTKIGLMDNFFMDEKGRYPRFFGKTEERIARAADEKEIENLRAAETDLEDGITNYENDEAEAAEQKSALDSALDTMIKDTDKDKPKDKGGDKPEPTFEDTYQTEFDRIQKLIGDDNTKGLTAIALSEAIGTPGTLADKAAVLNKSLLGIIGNKKKDKKEIAMLAYKATKEIEKAKIVAGKQTDSAKNFEELKTLNRIIQDDTGTYNEDQKKNARSRLKVIEASISSLNPAKAGLGAGFKQGLDASIALDEAADKIIKFTGDKNSDKYKKMIGKYNSALAYLNAKNDPSLNSAISTIQARLQAALGKKDGGRIERALGSPETGEVGTMPISQTTNNSEVPTAQVSNLSFKELRDRLPPEVTDDVIRFLTQSNQALQDFAYIRTAGDIKKFNMKYGLNLVLPAQQA